MVEQQGQQLRAGYRPDGMTALHDAVGLTLEALGKTKEAKDRNVRFLAIIVSDGAENNSKFVTQEQLAERIAKLLKTKRFEFRYLGAGQELSKVAQNLALPDRTLVMFDATPVGFTEVMDQNRTFVADWLRNRKTAGNTFGKNSRTFGLKRRT